MKLPTKTTLEPLNEAMQMLVECIHDVVECYELHDENRITFTRNGVDFTAYIWPTDEPSMPGGDLMFHAGRDQNGFSPPDLKIKADGTFWIGDKEVPGGEEFRDAFALFAKMMHSSWQTDVRRADDQARYIRELQTELGGRDMRIIELAQLEQQSKREKFLGAH